MDYFGSPVVPLIKRPAGVITKTRVSNLVERLKQIDGAVVEPIQEDVPVAKSKSDDFTAIDSTESDSNDDFQQAPKRKAPQKRQREKNQLKSFKELYEESAKKRDRPASKRKKR